jgi:hypothetical protein
VIRSNARRWHRTECHQPDLKLAHTQEGVGRLPHAQGKSSGLTIAQLSANR